MGGTKAEKKAKTGGQVQNGVGRPGEEYTLTAVETKKNKNQKVEERKEESAYSKKSAGGGGKSEDQLTSKGIKKTDQGASKGVCDWGNQAKKRYVKDAIDPLYFRGTEGVQKEPLG